MEVECSKLTHRHTSYKSTQCDGPEDTTHMARAVLGHKFVDEGTESVEEEVFDHHLEDEDLRALGAEGVAALMLVHFVEAGVGASSFDRNSVIPKSRTFPISRQAGHKPTQEKWKKWILTGYTTPHSYSPHSSRNTHTHNKNCKDTLSSHPPDDPTPTQT